MYTMTDVSGSVIGGVDTHRDEHVAAALTPVGKVLGTQSFAATAVGYAELLGWLTDFGEVLAVGVEGTGSYGKGLTRSLREAGVAVIEVNRPNRQTRRRNGKSDPADAIAAGRAVLSGEADAVPKTGAGPAEGVRVLRIARDTATKARTQAINAMRALVVTAPEELHDELAGLSVAKLAARVESLPAGPDDYTTMALQSLVLRWRTLGAELKALEPQLHAAVTAAAPPPLLEQLGVGDYVAASITMALGDNPERLMRSDACLAALAGTAPKDASSGLNQRHRLNRDGNRDLNSALYRIAIVRLRYDPPTQAYVARRISEGKTKKEAIRCVKRYITREIWKIYRDHLKELAEETVRMHPIAA